jgi:Ser/Thr protein kinase RdoA (MazF antagonist)
MNRLPGESRSTLRRPAEAGSAGGMLARFHTALLDLSHDFHNVRPGVHDTARHLARLRDALRNRTGHPRFRRVEPLGQRILDAAGSLPDLPAPAQRIVHGDPKINNFLFEPGTDRVLCLVDFDTLSRMALPLELGDAFRSWCNPGGEDTAAARFSGEMMLAGARGYAEHAAPWVTDAEIRGIAPATLTICVELAARFCADALNEDFFGWDPRRFPSHSEHSEVRAAGQLALSDSLRSQLPQLARDIPKIFAAAGTKA